MQLLEGMEYSDFTRMNRKFDSLPKVDLLINVLMQVGPIPLKVKMIAKLLTYNSNEFRRVMYRLRTNCILHYSKGLYSLTLPGYQFIKTKSNYIQKEKKEKVIFTVHMLKQHNQFNHLFLNDTCYINVPDFIAEFYETQKKYGKGMPFTLTGKTKEYTLQQQKNILKYYYQMKMIPKTIRMAIPASKGSCGYYNRKEIFLFISLIIFFKMGNRSLFRVKDILNMRVYAMKNSSYLDPRSELHEDHELWNAVLKIADRDTEDPMFYGLMSGLRIGGSTLKVGEKSLEFAFGPDFDDLWKMKIKSRWIAPRKDKIKNIFNQVYKEVTESPSVLT